MHICAILPLKIIYRYLKKQQVWLVPKSLILSFRALSSCNMNNTCGVQCYFSDTQILGGGVTWSNLAKHQHIHTLKDTNNLTGTLMHI